MFMLMHEIGGRVTLYIARSDCELWHGVLEFPDLPMKMTDEHWLQVDEAEVCALAWAEQILKRIQDRPRYVTWIARAKFFIRRWVDEHLV